MNKPRQPDLYRLDVKRLRRTCDPGALGFETTSDVEALEGVMGQERAFGALAFGARVQGDGFNLFVLGRSGSRRHELVRGFLSREARERAPPPDWCYVNNFEDPQKPIGIPLPAGTGTRLRGEMNQLLEDLHASVPAAFESENYRNRRAEIEQEFNERHRRGLEAIQSEAENDQLGLIPTPHGFAIAPLREGQVLDQSEFNALPEAERERIEAAIARLSERLKQHLEQLPAWHKSRRAMIKELDRQVTMLAIGPLIDQLKRGYADFPAIETYLDNVRRDVLDNVHLFVGERDEELPMALAPGGKQSQLKRYEVNVMVNNARVQGAPIIHENNPVLPNLVGRVEYSPQFGALVTDFTLIRAGALQAASGGYLMLDAEKVLMHPMSWEGLKRALTTKEVRLESLAQAFGLVATQGLEPDAMPLDVKVVLFGSRRLYYLLCALDPEFSQLFKVAADFEDHIERTGDNERLYARMLATMVREKNLLPFSVAAVARVIEESARAAEDSARLSTRLREIGDLLGETDFWGRQRGAKLVDTADVTRAVAERTRRLDRLRTEMQTAIIRRTLRIETDGTQVGQVNGLSVFSLGEFSFGQPSRISATVRLGDGRVIDIEREVELGGAIHSKGVLILASFLGSRFARNLPLSFAASLVFEQSYAAVEGDSASVAELVALLSAIAQVPMRQDLAVTGAVDQLGNVQAVGGVNEKVEGFFDVCRARGLTGHQGVLLPADNVQHLMLRPDLVEAVAEGRFHVYEIRCVDDAVCLLSGKSAGERGEDGRFPRDSVNFLVEEALHGLAEQRRRFNARSDNVARSADS